MSKVAQVISYCDNPLHEEQVPAVAEHSGKVDGGSEMAVDVCANCQMLVETWSGILARGVPSEPPAGGLDEDGRPIMCPECGTFSKARNGLSQHLRSQHDKRMGDYPNQLRSTRNYVGLSFHY